MSGAVTENHGFDANAVAAQLRRSGLAAHDVLHVAATLEMLGWTDGQAAALGYDSVFALAAAVYNILQRGQPPQRRGNRRPDGSWYRRLGLQARAFIHGIAFAVPMMLTSLSVFSLRYSLWSYLDTSTDVATGIALGTFASFLVTGGFVQIVARRGLLYAGQRQYRLIRLTSVRLLVAALAVAAICGLLGSAMLAVVPVMPWTIVRIALLYYFLLSLIWLGISLLYMLELYLATAALFTLSIGLVVLLFEGAGLPIMLAQSISMAVMAASALAVAIGWLRRLEKRHEEFARAARPDATELAQSLVPYFLYGFAFYVLLFADRIVAWSVPSEFHPFAIWFLGDYELGLDLALWTLVLPFGLVEAALQGLFRTVKAGQKDTSLTRLPALSATVKRQHVQYGAAVLLVSVVSMYLIAAAASHLQRAGWLLTNPLADPVTRFVFLIAAPAYGCLAAGLLNAMVCFGLNAPWDIVKAVGRSLIAHVAAGFVLSRYLGYEWAVVGLALGAVVFLASSTRSAWHVLSSVDLQLLRVL